MSGLTLVLMLVPDILFAQPPVPDPVLADQRGGFQLPGGIDVALTVQTTTAVDGAVVLRTVFAADRGPAALSVYVPKPGEVVPAEAKAAAAGTVAMPTVTYDRRSGITVTPALAPPSVTLSTGAAAADGGAGLTRVDAGGAGVATDAGHVVQHQQGGLQTVELRARDLDVTHLAGTAFGSAVANSGNDRTIDTQTVVSIDLRNAGPDVLGSSMLRAQDVATDALTMRAR